MGKVIRSYESALQSLHTNGTSTPKPYQEVLVDSNFGPQSLESRMKLTRVWSTLCLFLGALNLRGRALNPKNPKPLQTPRRHPSFDVPPYEVLPDGSPDRSYLEGEGDLEVYSLCLSDPAP